MHNRFCSFFSLPDHLTGEEKKEKQCRVVAAAVGGGAILGLPTIITLAALTKEELIKFSDDPSQHDEIAIGIACAAIFIGIVATPLLYIRWLNSRCNADHTVVINDDPDATVYQRPAYGAH